MSIDLVEFETALENITKQKDKIIEDIAQVYSEGMLDDPSSAYMFCSLLACICEGKVEGTYSKEEDNIQWVLTEKYHASLLSMQEQILSTKEKKENFDNVIKGPWK
jgi:hypothetical protein|tara:strand:- start:237 stop:554 length:318 start_codon:yes stop_codon:yes gene_type:complete